MPFLQPEQALEYLDITPGMLVADFGSGSGHWAIALARRVGTGGKVFAVDVLPQALEATRSQAKLAHLYNIETIWGDLEAPGASKLKDNLLHLILLSNLISWVDEVDTVLKEAYRVLMPNGRVVVIERDSSIASSTADSHRSLPRQDAEKLMVQSGFSLEKEFSAGSYHYGLIFRK